VTEIGSTYFSRARGCVALVIATAALIGFADPGAAQAPLQPQVAYPYEISTDSNEIRLKFEILDGYYLYREKFNFAIDSSGDSVEFVLGLQGCADIGLCYPPQKWPTELDLPAGPVASAPSNGSLFAGTRSDEPLPVEQAFIPNPRFDSANELTVSWQITPGYYLYRDKFTFDVDGDIQFGALKLPPGIPYTDQNFGDVEVYKGGTVALGEPQFPAGEIHSDEFFGEQEIYRHDFEIVIPFARYDVVDIVVPFNRAHPNEQQLAITAGYQGCKDESICYPPAEALLELRLPPSDDFASTAAAPPVMVSEQDMLADLVSNGSMVAVIGAFFVAGLALALTPCVYPMIPILSSIIAGQGQISHGRSFALSVSYVLGMAITYSAAGALTAMAGSQVQAVFQQPWIIASVAGLFVIMALAMFGLFEIQMPSAIQSRLSGLANKQKNGSFYGTAVIGALSALIVTTCVAPPLIAALIAIGQSGDVARGSFALFVMAIGMGTPLLLIGASAGKILPKAGPWMNAIKAGFGVLMIGMAIWMLGRVLPGTVTLLLWALLIFMTGVFLGAFESLPPEPKPVRRLGKGIGVLACLYGALMLIGFTLGGDDPLEPIPLSAGGFVGRAVPEEAALPFIEVETVAQLESLLAQASSAGQPVMMDFTADWCVSCKEMEEYTFPDASVVAALEPFLLLRADVTANNEDDQALLGFFQSYGPPTMAFFDRAGQAADAYRLYGYVEAEEFSNHVSAVASL
jgi:thiol:disulfide interchange protein DsbD